MDNTEKKGRSGGTVGVGYISIMLIFTVICLTIFAVLSFQAVYSSDKMTNRSDGFTQQYYTADTEAKKTLSRLDGLAAEALDGFSFEEGFIEAVSGVEGVSAARTAGGVRVEYSQAINERQTLAVSVVFFSAPSGERFRIEKWNSTEKEISGESHPSVWDGEDLV
ncbi:MAG: hypothetical protein KH345_08850 [Eubacterium sp.]|nr:hypothetical protein [Eubacterium sp.]